MKQGMAYGKELVLDMHGCDPSLFNRQSLRVFFKQLCELIDMQPEARHFWDDVGVPLEERETEPHLVGTSAIQFIRTSNITVHTLDLLEAVYLNIFSCKDFDAEAAADFTVSFFKAKKSHSRVLDRI